jgi:hypothetical protein
MCRISVVLPLAESRCVHRPRGCAQRPGPGPR